MSKPKFKKLQKKKVNSLGIVAQNSKNQSLYLKLNDNVDIFIDGVKINKKNFSLFDNLNHLQRQVEDGSLTKEKAEELLAKLSWIKYHLVNMI